MSLFLLSSLSSLPPTCIHLTSRGTDEQDQIASAAYDRILRVWDVESAKQIRTFSGHTQSTLAVDYDNTGKLLASGYVVFLIPLGVVWRY